jgi:exoribonuclease R
MNNIYESTYNLNILPHYGNQRNQHDDIYLLNNNNYPHAYSIENRKDLTNLSVYTIDPPGCEDADDGFSVYEENNKLYLAIHIADPTEYIELNSELWKDIINRNITKYPSNRKPIHLMPNEIVELSSLTENNKGDIKNAISIITEIDKNSYKPVNNINLFFSKIKVNKFYNLNYNYASNISKNDFTLATSLKIANSLKELRKNQTLGTKLNDISISYPIYNNRIYLYTDSPKEILMKQMIAEFAIFANSFVGEYLKHNLNGMGIFRTCPAKDWLNTLDQNITGQELLNKIVDNGIRANYLSEIAAHDFIGIPEYCHFTSPIRRVSDCICHYLLKYIYLKNKNNININCPFTVNFLEEISKKCNNHLRKSKKIQYTDNKFRLIQTLDNMINIDNKQVELTFRITGYNGLFINIIISKINNMNIYMSYSLRIKNLNYIHQPNQLYIVKVNSVKCLDKYDEGTIHDLDNKINEMFN